jgi:hypothetical protein
MRVLIKFVRKAQMWCITIINLSEKNELNQKQEWFSTEEEAQKRYQELLKKI